ncbi:fimbrial biogenesis chaperone [Deinococcus roseus]|uniref:Pili assembly chaperone N-terminal domain-containing protein n=1 Tax=Deinococcus roseus TaxID=392414 RepID=A0ABQ2DGL8_9DEIO|nr:fimbria/pilus periplasmic chaperone [Deinococcus roseus]GGJ53777.1 hypothetical protein GCM10008938_44760 [Deinococcus roseus]
MVLKHFWVAPLTALCLLSSALAGSFQLSPTSIHVDLREQTGGLTVVRNTSDTTSVYRITVVLWTQPDGDVYLSTRDLVVNPLQFTLQPGAQQTIRVVVRNRPQVPEQAYKVIVEEVPAPKKDAGTQVLTKLRVTLPVLVRNQDVSPQLGWSVTRTGADLKLTASNTGNGRGLAQDIVAELGSDKLALNAANIIAGGKYAWVLKGWGEKLGDLKLSYKALGGQMQTEVLPLQ